MDERVINVAAQVDQVVQPGDRVRVRLKKGGVEVEIESPIDKVSEVVARVVEGLASVGGGEAEPPPAPRAVQRRGSTCRDLVAGLWEEGWFSEPRGLGEVVAELSRRGYNYNSTAVSHALADLAREGVLTRLGTPRTYRYVQRRPPSAP